MAWEVEIPDVVAGQPIASAWGNTIRDRVVHRIPSVAALPTVPDGGLAYVEDVDRLYLRRVGVWVALPGPLLGYKIGAAQGPIAGAGATITSLTIPAVTVPAGRVLRVKAVVYVTATVNGDVWALYLRQAGAVISRTLYEPKTAPVLAIPLELVIAPGAVAGVDFTVSTDRVSGTGSVNVSSAAASGISFHSIEDLGAA